jgi:hypothetical protein
MNHPVKHPKGLQQVLDIFGDPRPYIQNKAGWERKILRIKKLPHPIPYAGDPNLKITRIRSHVLLIDNFVEAIEECLDLGVSPERLTYGGIYNYRLKRASSRISTHTWGIAIDIDPARNPMNKMWEGCKSDMMCPLIIKVFKSKGFRWGGRWKRPDCMHFQYCSGY